MLIPKGHQLSTFEAAVALGLVVLTARPAERRVFEDGHDPEGEQAFT